MRNPVHRMDYPRYRAAGWLIGSGAVEAAWQSVVGQRLKGGGDALGRGGCGRPVPTAGVIPERERTRRSILGQRRLKNLPTKKTLTPGSGVANLSVPTKVLAKGCARKVKALQQVQRKTRKRKEVPRSEKEGQTRLPLQGVAGGGLAQTTSRNSLQINDLQFFTSNYWPKPLCVPLVAGVAG